MNLFLPAEILENVKNKGIEKTQFSTQKLLILSFMGGMYIALGYLAYVRVVGTMPPGSLSNFIGACVFPVGLMAVLLGGGELITGNMLVVAVAYFKKAISLKSLFGSWAIVTLGNLLGAVATAYFFGHITGLTEGMFLEKTISLAASKIAQGFGPALVSGIGCNIFVGLGVWLSFGAKDFSGKILAIWFPVMAFVAIGFQHVVANMFIIPAAIFAGTPGISWFSLLRNGVPVYIGNAIGGAFVLGFLYCTAYQAQDHKAENKSIMK